MPMILAIQSYNVFAVSPSIDINARSVSLGGTLWTRFYL